MLEISFKENKWNPPELDKEVLTSQGIEYIQGKRNLARRGSFPYCDAFIIVRFWPYIDSVFVPRGSVEAVDPESMKRFVFHEDYRWDFEDEIFLRSIFLIIPVVLIHTTVWTGYMSITRSNILIGICNGTIQKICVCSITYTTACVRIRPKKYSINPALMSWL